MMPEDSRSTADDTEDDMTAAPWDFGRDLPDEGEMADLRSEDDE